MNLSSLPLEKTNQFSNLFLDYIKEAQDLKAFYGRYPSLENFKGQLQEKQFDPSKREVLVSSLKEQYKDFQLSAVQNQSIEQLLLPETFTITTGHQLSLATGPLYFIYKILTTIRLTEELTKAFPENNFVPVFWMATEDHDIAEINHFYLFGKKYEWETSEKGPSGKISTANLKELFEKVPDCPAWLSDAYCNSKSLVEATRKVAQYLFGTYGLIVIDGDDKNLKKQFTTVIENDLLENKYAPIAKQTSEELQNAGYKAQAFVRNENFFYLGDQTRERIEKQDGNYKVLNSDISFDNDSLQNEIGDFPERFSPNVILRPLYQEMILPNLAYIGGPGELAYWLQLKGIFESENIPFPILFPRKFATIIGKATLDKVKSANLDLADLFLHEKDFFELLIEKLQVEKLEFNEEENLLLQIKNSLLQKATKADKSFFPAIEAEVSKINKGLEDLGKRLNKALENKHETELNKLQNLKRKLFPNNELQERSDNFLNFYINNPDFISAIHKDLDPFEFKMECLMI
ncbi:MAG: bacillithiol biosynthesis cysteine-adding enzyme BshC [Opitutaceae bacterium]|nr:bacillithiol biosynthesis cysteine-adding enzyme BshC [Cytophagales bacterium]